MPPIRVLIIVGALFLVILLVRQLLSSNKKIKNQSQTKKNDGQIVACEQCGVHVPEAELVRHNGIQICRQCKDRAA